jgi:hypothetical protein
MSHGPLIFGVGLLLYGLVYTCMGESYERFYGWIYRSKEPTKFWWSVGNYYFFGIFFILADVFDLPSGLVLGILCVVLLLYALYSLLRWVICRK